MQSSNSSSVNFTSSKNTKKIILTSLLSALICVSTMIIKIPTPTNGYIHPGDGFVLLSSILLGPLLGGFAAGFGSALADLVSGYVIYVPATFIIKALTSIACYFTFKKLSKLFSTPNSSLLLSLSALTGELFMVIGYFIFEIFLMSILNSISLSSSIISASAGLVPNIVQGLFGILVFTILFPILNKHLLYN